MPVSRHLASFCGTCYSAAQVGISVAIQGGVVCELRWLETLGRLGSMAHDQKNRSGSEIETEAEAVNLKSLSIFCQ